MPNGKTKKKLPRLSRLKFSENFGLLLVSFVLAIVTWVAAKNADTEEARIVVPVMVTPKDARVDMQVKPEAVPVVLRYPKEIQRDISSANFRFEVDAKDLREGLGLDWSAKTQVLGERNLVVNLPRQRRVDIVRFELPDKTVEVRMRWNAQPATVEPDIVGADKLPQGFQLVTPVKVQPRDVFVAGDADALARAPRDPASGRIRLATDRINVADRTRSGPEQVAIKVPQGLEIVQPATVIAEVSAEVQEVQTIREIRGVPLRFAAVRPDSVELDYRETTATVTVFGPQSMLTGLGPDSFEIALQRPSEEVPGAVKDLGVEARFAASVPEDLRSRLEIRAIEPRSVHITYRAKQAPAPAPQ
jgi:hypothetical protein